MKCNKERVLIVYFVDRQWMEEILVYMETQLDLFKNQSAWTSRLEQLALERMAHTVIESVLDVANAMIDGFIMRDPGSYDDIIDILIDEKVVHEEMSEGFKAFVSLRKILVKDYIHIDHNEVLRIFHNQLEILIQFPKMIRQYLLQELGPVSAFKNDL
jgi:uncharacterized protein YutE (UPF0331/DUF86 family)